MRISQIPIREGTEDKERSLPAVCQREPLLIQGPASAAIYIALPLSKVNYAILHPDSMITVNIFRCHLDFASTSSTPSITLTCVCI